MVIYIDGTVYTKNKINVSKYPEQYIIDTVYGIEYINNSIKFMNKILAFAGSSSIHSINKKLAVYATSFMTNSTVTTIDLNDYEMPIFSVDKEMENGIHPLATAFKQLIEDHDGIVLSLAEHNGAYSAAFKNIFDWVSRIEGPTWGDKPMLLMATSPGGRGGSSVLGMAASGFPFNGGVVVDTFSLPFFGKNFDVERGIILEEKKEELRDKVLGFEQGIG